MSDRPIPQGVLAALELPAAASARRLGGGHIHRSWRVDGPDRSILLQRLNDRVFARPEQVVRNAEAIAAHLCGRRAAGEYPLEVPLPIPAADGRRLIRDEDGGVWRAMEFVEDSCTVAVVDTPRQAGVAAAAFGAFDAAMADFDPDRLHEVIPRFHDLGWRMEQLSVAASRDAVGRAGAADKWISLCAGERAFVDQVAALTAKLPRRVCHNDTKINNMLFDARKRGLGLRARAVIDLDTCMPGCWMHDYGDMVRTFSSPEPEDSTCLTAVRARDDVVQALTEGFLSSTADRMTALERSSLSVGARAMAFMVGVRFLTDWLEGDRYFATRRPDQNLDRARNQFALYRDLTDRAATLFGDPNG